MKTQEKKVRRYQEDTKHKDTRSKNGKKIGRPRKEWKVNEVEGLGRLKATLVEIAAFYKVSEDTVVRWNTDPAFREARKRGEDSRAVSLRRAQWRAAMKGSIPMLIFLGKNELGQRDVPKEEAARQAVRFRSVIGRDGSVRTEVVMGQESGALPPGKPAIAIEKGGETCPLPVVDARILGDPGGEEGEDD